MPFTLDDLDRYRVRVGTGEKSLRELTDTQFTAWLRGFGAEGTITLIETSPGRYETPLEDRVRMLNELEAGGLPIPGVTAPADARISRGTVTNVRGLTALLSVLQVAATNVEIASGLAQELGEIDARMSLRGSLSGAQSLLEAARGATERALRAASSAHNERA